MKYSIFLFLVIYICNQGFTSENKSPGDLTKQKPVEKKIYLRGDEGKSHYFYPNTLEFKTGKLYKLVIINESNSKHYFTSYQFAKSIFTRKIQVILKGKKVAEIKGNIDNVEVFPHNQLEWWFVPVKTGEFSDLHCSIIDKISKKKHFEMGMVGKILIK
tara:strand:+ start:127 stop:603 length:477 start_codon:yes stop_codon:yes gene_type:complete